MRRLGRLGKPYTRAWPQEAEERSRTVVLNEVVLTALADEILIRILVDVVVDIALIRDLCERANNKVGRRAMAMAMAMAMEGAVA